MTITEVWFGVLQDEALRYAYVLGMQGVVALLSALVVVLAVGGVRRRSELWPAALDQVSVGEPRG